MAVVLIPEGMVPQIFLPAAEPLVAGAAGADPLAAPLRGQTERARDLEVVRGDGAVAGIGAGGGTGPPQQPRPDPALVAGDGPAGQVVAQRADRRRRLHPCG